MTLQAKILTRETIAIGGETITSSQLSDAVDDFNDGDMVKLVTMEDWPGPRQLNLDKVVGKAFLELDGNTVVASIALVGTPMANIVKELLENEVNIYLRPVAAVIPANNTVGRRLKIERLIVVSNPESPHFMTPLQQVKDWVTGQVHTPMYQIKDK